MAASTTTSHPPSATSYYRQMLATAENPDFRLKDFMRLLLMQMCLVCCQLGEVAVHPSLSFKVGTLMAQIRALRDVAATARSLVSLTVQEDVINLDGAKFSYVFGRLIAIFRKSVLEAGGTTHEWKSICLFLGNNLAEAEPEIRRDIKKAHKLSEPHELPWSRAKSTPAEQGDGLKPKPEEDCNRTNPSSS